MGMYDSTIAWLKSGANAFAKNNAFYQNIAYTYHLIGKNDSEAKYEAMANGTSFGCAPFGSVLKQTQVWPDGSIHRAGAPAYVFDQTLKIDRAFVSNVERNAQSAAIIRAVIGLGKGLHLPIIAEGVETAEQLAFLTRVACDEVQGYLIGRPCPIAGYDAIVGRVASTDQQTAMVG